MENGGPNEIKVRENDWDIVQVVLSSTPSSLQVHKDRSLARVEKPHEQISTLWNSIGTT